MRAYLLFAALFGQVSQQSPTGEELLDSVRQMNAWIQDVAFDWELRGKPLIPAKGSVNAPLRTGHYRYRPGDGAMWIEFHEYQDDGRQYKYSLSYFAGVKRQLIEDLGTGSNNAITERLPKRWGFQEGDLPWYIFHVPYITDLSPKETPVEFLGWENQSGHRCAHLAVYTVGIRNAGRHLWLDLTRGGHPLRLEDRYKGDIPYGVTKDILLVEVPSPEGKKVWFPVKGTAETIWEGRPVYRSEITITQETIRSNQGLRDRDFDMAVPSGVAVTNLSQPMPVPFGTGELPSTAQGVPTVVADTVRRAEQQKAQTEARSLARRPVSWPTLVSWFLAGTAVVFLGAVLYLRRARS